mmetsp:Transcript_1991/g.2585  ORF Transcript_1991/g.2585 Transcript_1991/m.2585 type:complete len:93 (-) Transcript_1991:553-831(-)
MVSIKGAGIKYCTNHNSKQVITSPPAKIYYDSILQGHPFINFQNIIYVSVSNNKIYVFSISSEETTTRVKLILLMCDYISFFLLILREIFLR